ncbi:hypothetical protein ACHAXT_007975 [Thalassiosira profunda]
MVSPRFLSAAVLLLASAPDPARARLAAGAAAARSLLAGTCTTSAGEGAPCAGDDECYGCSNNGKACVVLGPSGCSGPHECVVGAGTCVPTDTPAPGPSGDGTCSNDSTASCAVDADCGGVCVGGRNARRPTAIRAGGHATPRPGSHPLPDGAGHRPESFRVREWRQCGHHLRRRGEKIPKYENNIHFYDFTGANAESTLGNIDCNGSTDFVMEGGFAHPFKLCRGGIVGTGITCVAGEEIGVVDST